MIKESRVLCVVPARGASKSIPLKNLSLLLGKPLLHYALSSALSAKRVDRVVVSSEHPLILDLTASYGERIPLRRPPELALDDTPSLPVLLHALRVCEEEDGTCYDIIILVQATNPLVLPQDIDATAEKLLTTGCDSCFTVTKLDHIYPAKLKRIEDDHLLPYCEEEEDMVRRQDLPEVYIRNGSCYGVKRATLLSGTFFGKDSRAVVVPRERSIDINEPLDLIFAEALMKMEKEKNTRF
jgi:CMP-N-acetylneuraminic acid synthetase